MATIVKQVENLGVNATVAAASAGAISQVMGYNSPLPVFGYNIPAPVIFALVGGGASLAQKATRDNIIPMIYGDDKLAPQTLAYVASPAITAGLFAGIDVALTLALGGSVDMATVGATAAIGGLSQLIANSLEKPVDDVIEIL